MLNKNYMAGNVHLSSEVAEPFDIRLKKEKPELAAGVDKLKELIPEDGVILESCRVSFTDGESVFDVLQRVCDEKGIRMEYSSVEPAHYREDCR